MFKPTFAVAHTLKNLPFPVRHSFVLGAKDSIKKRAERFIRSLNKKTRDEMERVSEIEITESL